MHSMEVASRIQLRCLPESKPRDVVVPQNFRPATNEDLLKHAYRTTMAVVGTPKIIFDEDQGQTKMASEWVRV